MCKKTFKNTNQFLFTTDKHQDFCVNVNAAGQQNQCGMDWEIIHEISRHFEVVYKIDRERERKMYIER